MTSKAIIDIVIKKITSVGTEPKQFAPQANIITTLSLIRCVPSFVKFTTNIEESKKFNFVLK
jgi:hypothetical protein